MPGIDYHRLRQQITIGQVLHLIGFQPTSRHGSQLRGPCPIPGCSSTSDRSFSVHLARQVYHCFACRSHGNCLDLWAAIRGLPIHQATLDLCHATNLDPPRLPASLRIPMLRGVPSRDSSRNR
jgi:DNA primase